MNDARLPTVIYFLMLILGLLEWAHVYPQLPERLASHFDAAGRPNGWQTKQDFFTLHFLVTGLSVVVAFLIPRLITVLPSELINLPHKWYWLAPERRPETQRYLSVRFAWLGCALLFVLLYATSLSIEANMPGHGRFDSPALLLVLGGFLLLLLVGTGMSLRHFYRVPEDARKPEDRPLPR